MNRSTNGYRTYALGMAGSLALAAALLAPPTQAGQLTYTPVNPSFGGNPLNGQPMLNKAQRANRHTQPMDDLGLPDFDAFKPEDEFNRLMESAVLSRVSTEAMNNLFGSDGKLVSGGTLETQNYSFKVIESGGQSCLNVTSKENGQTTTICL